MTTWVVTGATGGLGATLADLWRHQFRVLTPSRKEMDLTQPDAIERYFDRIEADGIVNCAAMARPDECEKSPGLARCINAEAPAALAKTAADRGMRIVQISTDFVFGGDQRVPLEETESSEPISVYGRTKLDGELGVQEACPNALIARVSWLFGRHKSSHPDHVLEQAMAGRPLAAIQDKWSIPTASADVAQWLACLLTHPASPAGVFHLAATGSASWWDWSVATVEIAEELGFPIRTREVAPLPLQSFEGFQAQRPSYSVLSNAKLTRVLGDRPSHWRDRLRDYLVEKSTREGFQRG
jgi:dTDP-4-dehydrorhamnose reductase